MLLPQITAERQTLQHLLIVEDTEGCRSVVLEGNSHSLGRSATNSIVLHSRRASRQHALLLRVTVPQSNQYRFRIIDGDLQGNRSTNGLFVNGSRCFSRDLQHGDLIEFGGDAKARYFTSTLGFNPLDLQLLKDIVGGESIEEPSQELSKGTIIAEASQPSFHNDAAIIRLASFPELSPHPILEINLSGTITYLNPAMMTKFPELQVQGLSHPILDGLVAVIKERQQNFFTRQVKVGQEYFEQSIHYLEAGEIIRCFITDVTQRMQTEAELRRRDKLLQAVAASTTSLLTNADLEVAIRQTLTNLGTAAGVSRAYIYENYQAETGEVAMKLRCEWFKLGTITPSVPRWQHQSYRQLGLQTWHETLAAGQPIHGLGSQMPLAGQPQIHRDGLQSLLLVPVHVDQVFWGYIGFDECTSPRRWSHTEEAMLVTMATSISGALKRYQTEELIRFQAHHDLLTGLPNRALFNERLTQALAQGDRGLQQLAVLFLDLDRFKAINDTLGHSIGDQLLVRVANRLQSHLREGDIFARWGGDEFIILLSNLHDPQDAASAAERLLSALQLPFQVDSHELYTTPSIGIAMYPGDGKDAETLLKHADAALYQSKQVGRNNYQFFNTSLTDETPKLLNLERRLRQALEHNEFILHYQPQVNLKTGQITGMEALIRWQDATMGLVSPQVFIPVVEESGLIVPIGEWALRTACQQNRTWQLQGLAPICIAVNLSARQLRQPNLTAMIARILDETGLHPDYLELEITETTAVQDVEFTIPLLRQIQEMGIKISMDDFGTGYSSLSYLQQLPLDSLKIDRSFVKDLAKNSRDAEIVTAVTNMARALQLNVVAEGVETQEQLRFLQQVGCQEGQGYLFQRPQAADQAESILREGKPLIQFSEAS